MRSAGAGEIYQIGELAALSGVTPDTLRYYERLGLLPRAQRTSGGFRVYTTKTLERLRFIKQAQSLGLTLQDVRDLLSYQSSARGSKRCQQVRDMLRSKLGEIEARLAELREFQNVLSGYLEECEQTLQAASRGKGRDEPACPVIETLTHR